MKKFFAVVSVVILIIMGAGYWTYQQKQEFLVPGTVSTPNIVADIKNMAFSELHIGKNDFNGIQLELFDISSMKKGKSETTNIDDENCQGDCNCQNGCNTITDYYFSYAGGDIKLTEDDWVSGGTAGEDVSYQVSVLNKQTGEWDNFGALGSEEGLRVVGYKDTLIFSGSYHSYHGVWGEDILAYDLAKMKIIPTKNFRSGTWGHFWAESLFDNKANTFYMKDRNLYLRAPKNKCYFLSDQPAYLCGDNCDLEEKFPYPVELKYVYAGCVAGYYPMDDIVLEKPNIFFKDEYAREAEKYNSILKMTDWAALPAAETLLQDFQYTASSSIRYNEKGSYFHPAEWLSPLIGRTLNLAMAGEDGRAWKMFKEDFVMLSTQYPLTDTVDPAQIELDLRIMLEDK